MAALRVDVFFLLMMTMIIFSSFYVHKQAFVQPDGISITCWKEDLGNIKETFLYSSLWANKNKNKICIKISGRSLWICLLLLCGDIEICPGPIDSMSKLTMSRGVKILHQNIRGLLGNIWNLTTVFEKYKNIDILTVSETHINSGSYSDNDYLYQIPGYSFEKRNRRNGRSGGICIYISHKFKWKRRLDLERDEIECMIIEIFPTNAKSFLVGCIYRPPDGSRYLPRDFDKIFEQILIAVNSLSIETIILGDLNVNYLKQHSGKELKNMIALNGFKQLIKGPTRITAESSTLIDVILSNNESSIAKTDVAALSLSDHDIIGCVRKLNHQQFSPRTITCRNYTNYNPNSMCEELLAHDMGKNI